MIPKWHLHSAPTASSQGGSLVHSEDVVGSLLWRMIWAKSTYLNDFPRNPAVAGFLPIRERIRAVARYPATARCLIA